MSAEMRNGLNDPNAFRTSWRPIDTGSPEHKTVQQIRQKCDEFIKFIDSTVVKGQWTEEATIIKTKALEMSFWANHLATRDKGNTQQNTGHNASQR